MKSKRESNKTGTSKAQNNAMQEHEREGESTRVFLQNQKMGFRRNLAEEKEENLST